MRVVYFFISLLVWNYVQMAMAEDGAPRLRVLEGIPVDSRYRITSPRLFGSWIVCALRSNQGSPTIPEGALAYNLASGRIVHLTTTVSDHHDATVEFVGNYFSNGRDKCSLEFCRAEKRSGQFVLSKEAYLCEWNLASNRVCRIGQWDDAKTISRVLDCRVIDMSVRLEDEKRECLLFQDKRCGFQTQLTIARPLQFLEPFGRYSHAGLPVFIESSDRRSVIFIRPTLEQLERPYGWPLEMKCIDPCCRGGVRWSWSTAQINEKLGLKAWELAPVSGPSSEADWFAVAISVLEQSDRRVRLAFVNKLSGTIERVVVLPIQSVGWDPYIIPPLLSPDGRLFAYVNDKFQEHLQKGHESGAAEREMITIDTRTCAIVAQSDITRYCNPECVPFAFDSAGRILGWDTKTIYAVVATETPPVLKLLHLR